jgi:hypothetical protein
MVVKDMLFRTRRGLFTLLLFFIAIIYYSYRLIWPNDAKAEKKFSVPEKAVYIFKGVQGPANKSTIKPPTHTSWHQYEIDNPSAMVLLLTDTQAHWLGIAHALAGIGIPFTVTTQVTEALRHKVVMVYPLVSGKVLKQADLRAIAAIPRNGGTLIATNVLGGGLNEIFDYDDIVADRQHTRLILTPNQANQIMDNIFSDVIDRQIILTDGKDKRNDVPTVGYTNAKNPLISFEDGTGCLVFKDYGIGKSYALGMDIGNYFFRYMNGRGFAVNRAYVNRYEAGIDILLRTIKQIYISGNEEGVTISSVPYNRALTLILTHDVDFTKSIVNAADYAKMEKDSGVKATYFIQTKYVRDWNDDIFFNDTNIKYLKSVDAQGMEVGSHSVAHSRVFSKFNMGTGTEKYPDYRPFVKERLVTYNGTILGELRVSKFLIENFLPEKKVTSFRPGHLQYPFDLPQALAATGYNVSSSVTSGSVQTNLPYFLTYSREYDATTSIIEIPVAVEDEAGLLMLKRLDSTLLFADQLAKYGGVMNILIHTDILGQKFEYEKKLIAALKSKAWVSTIGEFGNWWRLRNNVTVSVVSRKGEHILTVKNGTDQTIKGLTLQVPSSWHRQTRSDNLIQSGSAIIIGELDGQINLVFK